MMFFPAKAIRGQRTADDLNFHLTGKKGFYIYHTKTLGNLKSIMQKLVATTLTFVLTFAVLISGASGYSDCAVRCMREMAKAHPHAAMGSTRLRVPDCCSGNRQSLCEMNTVVEVKIPECSIPYSPTVFSYLSAVGMIARPADVEPARPLQVGQRILVKEFYKDPPIYLQTLSLLS
jgi:hypothetical protein